METVKKIWVWVTGGVILVVAALVWVISNKGAKNKYKGVLKEKEELTKTIVAEKEKVKKEEEEQLEVIDKKYAPKIEALEKEKKRLKEQAKKGPAAIADEWNSYLRGRKNGS
jgi:flagellar biosynthesis/type III secretory pathway M-ring protein FliF/YscJ